jgi:predicted dehydrogenase
VARDLRIVIIGAGWIVPIHVAALERLRRATIVGVAASRLARTEAIATPLGARASTDAIGLLDDLRPDAVYLCVPPFLAVGFGEALVERAIPFLTEKPLAATDADGPVRLGAAIAANHLVVGVGYHLRGLEGLSEVRALLAVAPPIVVAGRWLGGTPGAAWWRRVDQGGGQVIEQATHLYDLGRFLAGEATVLTAAAARGTAADDDADVADATAAVLRFESGAVGSFVNTRRALTSLVEVSVVADGFDAAVRRDEAAGPGGWRITLTEGGRERTLPAGRDPYEVQAERFVDAVEAGDPGAVLSTYADALKTDRLTRAVVAATGEPG